MNESSKQCINISDFYSESDFFLILVPLKVNNSILVARAFISTSSEKKKNQFHDF